MGRIDNFYLLWEFLGKQVTILYSNEGEDVVLFQPAGINVPEAEPLVFMPGAHGVAGTNRSITCPKQTVVSELSCYSTCYNVR